MNPSSRASVFLALSVLITSLQGSPAQSRETPSLPFNPQDGETVVFLGDSITHQCLYTQYLENFFITRYPERRIRFINSGVAGDAAEDVLARFEDDVAVHQPDYVTVLLGMNDGRYEEFDAGIFKAYQDGMKEILDRIDGLGAKAIVLSPTMFDHAIAERRADDAEWRFRDKEFPPNYNALMTFFGAWAMEEAGRREIPFVALWGPLNRHTIAERRSDPGFTMIWDAIHPQASGQFVMAFEVLSQLGVEQSSASATTITKRGNRWAGSKGVENLQVNDEGTEVRFSRTPNSLPWVIPEKHTTRELRWKLPSDGRVGYALTKAGHKLSADRLKIAGLAPGTYEVLIDGKVIGTWSHITLGTKIEIQENEKTPQYQQALKVAELNRTRTDEFVRPARDLGGRVKGLRKRAAANPGSPSPKLEELLAEMRSLNEKAEAKMKKIHEAARPKASEWVIRRVVKPPRQEPKKKA